MPTVNRRERPRLSPISAKSWASLPTDPSVRNTIWRSRLVSAGVASNSAAFSAGSISVPPSASSRETKCLATARLSGVASTGAGKIVSIVSSKRITLNLSPGRRRSSAKSRLCFAWTMEVPAMEPELSMTKISSRGTTFAAVSKVGGVTMATT